jgi:cytochrome c-type biogenesis protein CcmH
MADEKTTGFTAGRLMLVVAALVALVAIYGLVQRTLFTPPEAAQTSTPTVPDMKAATDPESVIRGLQEAVGAHPNDPTAWQKLGYVYYMTQRFADSTRAYRRATALAPDKAILWSALGEAIVMSDQQDPMPAEAHAAFEKAVSLDPKDERARYFLAVARDLKGDHEGAISDWLAILADTPVGAPWEADLKRTIIQVAKINQINVAERLAAVKQSGLAKPGQPTSPGAMIRSVADPVATGAIPGPTPAQMHAASALSPRAQEQMVRGMVDGLEAKLKADPRNVDGWIRLMRSRMTLGQSDKAMAARDAALRANPADAVRIANAAAALGVPGSMAVTRAGKP